MARLNWYMATPDPLFVYGAHPPVSETPKTPIPSTRDNTSAITKDRDKGELINFLGMDPLRGLAACARGRPSARNGPPGARAVASGPGLPVDLLGAAEKLLGACVRAVVNDHVAAVERGVALRVV